MVELFLLFESLRKPLLLLNTDLKKNMFFFNPRVKYDLTKKLQVPAMRVLKCSHVGGHKYAGNIIVYGKEQSHWTLCEIHGSQGQLKALTVFMNS